MSDNDEQETLSQLKDTINTRLQERLAQILQEEKKTAAKAGADSRAALDRRLAELGDEHKRRIRFETDRMSRKAADDRQTRLWNFEREKMAGIEQAIRQKLSATPPDPTRFKSWLESAQTQLEGDMLVLEISEQWQKTLGLQSMEVRVRPLLGGAILTDSTSGRQVDGSWDWHLAAIMPGIREKWRKDVGADH